MQQTQNRFSLLRSILRGLGLSQSAADDIVDRILDFLSDEDERKPQTVFPYALRDDFLSKAELNFYRVLVGVVSPDVTVLTKVSLGDLFYAKSGDSSEWRIYTNKIDRKHVDFLLCDRQTMQPLAGIELDDRSHQRADRQERDAFVDQVFEVTGLPLHRVRVQRSYALTELRALLDDLAAEDAVQADDLDEAPEESPSSVQTQPARPPVQLAASAPSPAAGMAPSVPAVASSAVTAPAVTASAATSLPSVLPGESLFVAKPPAAPPAAASSPAPAAALPAASSAAQAAAPPAAPICPKCGSAMVLRTARQGANRGGQFWGCSNYPKCHGIVAA